MNNKKEKLLETCLENVYKTTGNLLEEVLRLQEYVSGVKAVLDCKNNKGEENEQERINTG